ncbi:alpha-N-arabinofuranosidase [Brachybacterium saurashtrense]|uniref:non-reducing end alpha-L-arabinofuranosidase n=1 Tax=Brachybacterium saurashtrense TaxID=556288 RepID=A0A345YQV7_9MICO|nr:alpha-N-arabinofuranosidase [Brachybacterium saurashtrense]AXK46309.1 alpha-L-arabinofuranosidase [Brachybacterium saurashtrense]RRR24049.1 alpha-L-arabinofuranosidase [Brachybacterium saurashtrense]
MSSQVTLTLNPAFRVAPVRRRTFGAFVEHLGRCVYTGIFEPDHPAADEDGFRTDVLALTRELGVSSVRYPGGNFVSGYRWEDGVGPVEQRPARHDLAWHSTEPNTVGLDEFMAWAKKAEVEPMYAVNLGTRGVEEALDVLQYANAPAGIALSDERAANGSPEPHGIRMWCLGNEMDGPWQTGHKTAEEYARLATEAARAMRQEDPELELIACGSSSSQMETFGAWENTVLTEAYDHVDMISAHAYYSEKDGDQASFLASADDMDHFIDSVVATADHVRAKLKRDKRIMISFDEWNIWYQHRAESRPPSGDDWPVAPVLLEDVYSAQDAVVFGNLLISLLRHSDRVASASLAQLVNVIAPIMTEPGGEAWKQSTFHPFALTSQHAKGEVLDVRLAAPTFENARFGTSSAADAVATWDEETGELAVFVVNRGAEAELALDADLSAFGDLDLVEALTLYHEDPYAANTQDAPDTVAPQANDSVRLEGGRLVGALPAISWSLVRLARRSA